MTRALPIHVGADADDAARQAAELIASELKNAIAQRGRASIAFSGGSTPWGMVRALAGSKVPWDKVDVFQVDERVAPAGDPDRNATHIQSDFIARAPCPRGCCLR
jgi:6-phosphogluconolactonase